MFNRGFRRDDRNSFRSNANVSRGYQAPSLMSVSPWEGGVVPGQPSSGGSSILGTPHLQGSQLTPQAQALAQNLNILSNLGLLQPQLQSRQTQALPSLINLGTALNRTLGIGQQNTGYLNRVPVNRYQDQRQKYGRPDMRRPDLFNKNRPRTSQSQSSQQKLQSYRPLNSKISPSSTTRKQGSQGGDSLAKARADIRGKRVKKEAKSDSDDAEVDEDAKKEEGEEVVKKRDWKKEKKTDVIEVDDEEDDEVKEKGSANETVDDVSNGVIKVKVESGKDPKEKEESSTESKEQDGDKGAKPSDSSIFNCHICSKTLQDEAELTNHMRTASHKRMVNKLEETYAFKVKRIRDQMRISEQEKELEMNIRNRGRRINMQRNHCKMCDLTFFGNITAHRKTPMHVKLKNFLHPSCPPCGKEFPARMEWDMHKLTVQHLRIAAGIDKRLKKSLGSASEPNYARLVPKFPEGLDSVVANMDEEMADKPAADTESKDEGTLQYDPAVITGINMLVHGQHCGVCNKFFARRPDALEHCKTQTHFNNYLEMKAKLKAAAEEEAAKLEEAKAKAAAEAEAKAKADAEAKEAASNATESDMATDKADGEEISQVLTKTPVVCLKRAVTRKDEGNWKRSRTAKNEEDDDEADEEDEEREIMKSPDVTEDAGDDEVSEVTDKLDGNLDKYDPLQPTSPVHSNEERSLNTSIDLLQAVENDIDSMETSDTGKAEDANDEDSPVTKPVNKARRGRKRK